jgi:hypothetical protein
VVFLPVVDNVVEVLLHLGAVERVPADLIQYEEMQ